MLPITKSPPPMQSESIGVAAHLLPPTAPVLDLLARQIRQLETAGRPACQTISSGSQGMDRCLPDGGYAPGSTIELLRSGPACGTTSIALMIARQAMQAGKYLVIVDQQRQFYPAAMVQLGIAMERVIVLHPSSYADTLWGLDQSLRCTAVGATIVTIHHLDDRVARRLQLAAEHGGGLGLLMRDAHVARQHPSWANVQWLVRCARARSPMENAHHSRDTRWFHMELLRCGGGRAGAQLRMAIDATGKWIDKPPSIRGEHEHASAVHLAAQLAQPTRRRREIAG